MVWDIFSGVYDPVEKIVNRKVYAEIGDIAARFVDKDDLVLECACGTHRLGKSAQALTMCASSRRI